MRIISVECNGEIWRPGEFCIWLSSDLSYWYPVLAEQEKCYVEMDQFSIDLKYVEKFLNLSAKSIDLLDTFALFFDITILKLPLIVSTHPSL
jgi:hypothetical protein